MNKPPNNKYWLKKADELFMSQFRGLPCEFCKVLGWENIEGTVFHHIVPKSKSKALRYNLRNGIVLCPTHHKWGKDMAVHSDNVYVIEKWLEFFKEHFRARYDWCKQNSRHQFIYTYKNAFEAFKAGYSEYTIEVKEDSNGKETN